MQCSTTEAVARLACALFALPLAARADVRDDDATPIALSRDVEVTTLVQGIGDAENGTFTPDGRLFVTGGENVYEITKGPDGYAATRLYDGVCNFTGIVAHDAHLFTTCAEGDLSKPTSFLLASSLDGPVKVEKIHQFTKVGIPNGIAFDERGRLFVADFTPLAGKLVTVSFAPSVPPRVVREDVWHDMGHPLTNGLKIFRGKVYFTDLTDIKVIPIASDGSAGRVTVLATRLGVLDDLLVSDDGIIVGDFYGGQLLYYDLMGKMMRQTPMLFRAPSSITIGRPPLVPEDALVITEKGAIGELTSDRGNRVSLYRLNSRANSRGR